jgi:phage baseplate assembly protein W
VRTFVRLILLCISLALLARAACAQPQALPAREPRCAALRALYIGTISDKAHRTVEEQSHVEYEEARKYLRVCWEASDDFTRSLRKYVESHEDFARCDEAWKRFEPRIRMEGSRTFEQSEQVYEASKEFLRICDGAETEKARSLKAWVEKYDAALRREEAEKSLASLKEEARAGSMQPSLTRAWPKL